MLRNMEDNLSLRKKVAEKEKVQRREDELRRQLDDIPNQDRLDRMCNDLEKKFKKFLNAVSQELARRKFIQIP
eukprot:SAG11_NODE_2069_length_3864_cov_2.863214_3_plen_73_part_00